MDSHTDSCVHAHTRARTYPHTPTHTGKHKHLHAHAHTGLPNKDHNSEFSPSLSKQL